MNTSISAPGASVTAERTPVSGTFSLDQVVATPVEWLWTGKIPRGAITVLAGNPGEGKSLLSLKLAARLGASGDGQDSPRPLAEVMTADLGAYRDYAQFAQLGSGGIAFCAGRHLVINGFECERSLVSL